MYNKSEHHTQIAIGWVLLLLVFVLMLVFMTIESAFMDDNFLALKADPGHQGVHFLSYVLSFYAVMPVITLAIANAGIRPLRWFTVVAAVVSILFILLHHLSHLAEGERLSWASNMLDITSHIIGFWVLYLSIRWARLDETSKAAVTDESASR